MNRARAESLEEIRYWVALNMVLGVGKTLFHRLMRALGSPERVFQASGSQLMSVEGVGEKTAAEISTFEVDKIVDREFRLLEQLGARILTVESSEYPPLLKAIYDPPPILYCQGKSLSDFKVPVAVVGTRAATNYGKIAVERLCSGLAARGVCIVSGMARGIDTLAHRAALQAGRDTIAVFGCGLSHTYPPENRSLREKIVENGAVISEFPFSMRPERSNFPARNRVISGLCYGTIVVEAGEKSGALITAEFALEQGREVFAVPGSIYSPKSLATNRLIKSGAKLVDDPQSVIEELPDFVQGLLVEEEAEVPELSDLQPNERQILSLLTGQEMHIDSLIENSRLSPAEVSATLVQLELRGLVRQLIGKMFISNYKTV